VGIQGKIEKNNDIDRKTWFDDSNSWNQAKAEKSVF